ncbi:MAG: AAA family ATPase, partial [Candidatus Izemoplasmatales bacterium]
DLIDEACASIRMEIDSMPSELDSVMRRIMQLEIEKRALEKESDSVSKDRLKKLKDELKSLENEEKTLRDRWENDKSELDKVKRLKSKLESLRTDLQNAFNQNDYSKAAELQYAKIPALEKEIMEKTEANQNHLVSEVVTENDIAGIVAKWTGIPVSKLMQGDVEKLLDLDEMLKKRVIGQDEAIALISDAILRQRAGIKNEFRPIGSFMFLGPTGVGKTEVARALAEQLFSSENHIVRIDMSEYMESFSVSRLIGAPPGYVGYDEGGQLTEAVRRKPYSIVLFDEIEKAHPEVFNILLQILDDGRLTDSQGRIVDFKNTIIIMTSNLGSELLLQNSQNVDQVLALVKKTFKPEFINRIDEIVVFHPLERETQKKIVVKMLEDLAKRVELQHIHVVFSDRLKDAILDEAFDPDYGARPLKRHIQRHVETAIAKAIVSSKILPNHTYLVDENNGITLTEIRI